MKGDFMAKVKWAVIPALMLAVTTLSPASSAAEDTSYAVGATLYARGLYADAALQFLGFVKASPQDALAPRALLLAAEARRRTGDNAAAYDLYQNVEKSYPKTPQSALAQLRVAEIEILNNKIEGRAKTLQSLKGLPPEAESLRTFLLAKVLVAEGRKEEASRVIEQAEGAGFAGGSAYLVKGDIALAGGDFGTALAAYQKALQEDRLKPTATLRLAELARRAGRNDDALTLYRTINVGSLPSEREKVVYTAGFGLSLLSSGDYRSAQQQLSSAIQFAKKMDDATRSSIIAACLPALSVSALLNGDMKLIDDLTADLPPNDSLTTWLRTWTAYRKGDFKSALQTAQSVAAAGNEKNAGIANDIRLVGAVSAANLKDWGNLKALLIGPFSGYPEYLNPLLQALRIYGEQAPPQDLDLALQALLRTSPPSNIASWAEALLASQAVKSGNLDNAEVRVKGFVSAYPTSPYVSPLRKSLLALAAASAPPAKIVELAKEYIASNPAGDITDAEELLAWGLYGQGQKKEAADALLKAHDIAKDQAVKGRLVYEAGLSLAEGGDEKAALKLLYDAGKDGFALPPDAAVWATLHSSPDEASVLAERLVPALKSEGPLSQAALAAIYRTYSSSGRWKELGEAIDVYLAARKPDEAGAEESAAARLYKAEAEFNLDRAASSFTLVDNALPSLRGFDRAKALLIRGRSLVRLGRPDEGLSDLLYVGMVVVPLDDASKAVVHSALVEARATAEKLGKNDLVGAIDKSLASLTIGKAQ
jgi:TolA-binding protein